MPVLEISADMVPVEDRKIARNREEVKSSLLEIMGDIPIVSLTRILIDNQNTVGYIFHSAVTAIDDQRIVPMTIDKVSDFLEAVITECKIFSRFKGSGFEDVWAIRKYEGTGCLSVEAHVYAIHRSRSNGSNEH